jgi:hypothetical protein
LNPHNVKRLGRARKTAVCNSAKENRSVEGSSGVEVPERHLHKKKTGPLRVRLAEFVGAGPTITFQRGTADD